MNEKKDNSKKHDIDELIAELQAKKALRESISSGNIEETTIYSGKNTAPKKTNIPKTSPAPKTPLPKRSRVSESTSREAALRSALQHEPITQTRETNPILYLFLIITIGITLYVYFITATAKMPNWQKKIESLNKIKATEELNLNELKKTYITYKALINRLTVKKPFFEGILKEVSLITPKSIELRNITLKDNTFTIHGMIEKEGNRQDEIKKFIISLTASPFFNDIKLKEIKHQRDKNLSTFEIKGGLSV